MIKIIAGIGSRQTPPEILAEMKKVGKWCRSNGVLVRSGHADGADWAFEQGAQTMCEAYIPWKGFNRHLTSAAKIITYVPTDEAKKSVFFFHPYPESLTPAVHLIMARNWAQVMGIDDKTPCDVVVCWTRNGKEEGGTSQAMRIAKSKGIPIINMDEYPLAELVIDQLIKL